MGSAVVRVPGTTPGAPFLAVVGHIDEIGLIVTHIDDEGFLRFIGVGGWDAQILVGQRAELLTRNGPIPGVVGRKAIHLLREEDRKKVPELRELHIDIGASSGDEARELVRIGDVAVLAGEPLELAGGRFISRSMDNRLGAFIALEAARLVAEAGGAPGDVAACGVVQEEIGLNGARAAALRTRAGRRDRRRRHPRDRLARRRGQRDRQPPLRRGSGDRARLDPQPRRLRAAATTPPSARRSRSRSPPRRAAPAPTPT